MLSVLALGFLGLHVSICSCSRLTQVPDVTSWPMPSLQSAGLGDPVVQSQVTPSGVTPSGVTPSEANLLQEPLPETNQSHQWIRKVSEASQVCEVDESTRVGCGEPGISPADCEVLECCYDHRQFVSAYDGPVCYYGKAGEQWEVNLLFVHDQTFIINQWVVLVFKCL